MLNIYRKDYNIFYHSNEGVHYNQDSYTIESDNRIISGKIWVRWLVWQSRVLGDATNNRKSSTGDKTLYAKYVKEMVSNELELAPQFITQNH